MNGIKKEVLARDAPLTQLPQDFTSPHMKRLAEQVSRNPQHPMAAVIQEKHRIIAISRTPALGHAGGPDKPYPEAAIKSESLLTMVQVRFDTLWQHLCVAASTATAAVILHQCVI